MRRTYEFGAKPRLSFSGGTECRCKKRNEKEEEEVEEEEEEEEEEKEEEEEENSTFAALYCAIFRMPSFRKSQKFFGTPVASLNPETVQLPE